MIVLRAFARLFALQEEAGAVLSRLAAGGLPGLLARAVFAAVLFGYFHASATTKVEPGLLGLFSFTDGAFVQIFPRAMEAAGYDRAALGWFPVVPVVALGTWAEFVLPVLVVAGLMTRLAALGLIGFIVVQSVVDVTGHGADAATLGRLFDRLPSAPILDQRSLWAFLLAVLVICGPGPFSCDRALRRLIR